MGELWQSLKIWSEADQGRGLFFAGMQWGKGETGVRENWVLKANNNMIIIVTLY